MNDMSIFEILLVEDNPRDVDLTLRALKRHNLANRVVVARDGAEALALIFGDAEETSPSLPTNPRLILLDLKLPKVDGMEVLRRIKAEKRTRTIPVVVLTSSNQERDMVESYQLGVNSYIVKPVDFDKFLDCVRQLGIYWLLINRLPEPQ
jgi:two-component system, response regulator